MKSFRALLAIAYAGSDCNARVSLGRGLNGFVAETGDGPEADAIVRYQNGWGKEAQSITYQVISASGARLSRQGRATVSVAQNSQWVGSLAGMASVTTTKTIACEKEMEENRIEPELSVSKVNCFVLTKSTTGDELTVGEKKELVRGGPPPSPGLPLTIHLAKVDDGKAVACYTLSRPRDQRLGALRGIETEERRLSAVEAAQCQVISLVGEADLSFGQAAEPDVAMPERGPRDSSDLNLVTLDTNLAMACYGTSEENVCTLLLVSGSSVSFSKHNVPSYRGVIHKPLVLGDRVTDRDGKSDSCVASRLTKGKAIVCCETATPSSSNVECNIATVTGSYVSISPDDRAVTVATTKTPDVVVPAALVHLSDTNGGSAVFCHYTVPDGESDSQPTMKCAKLQVDYRGTRLIAYPKYIDMSPMHPRKFPYARKMALSVARLAEDEVLICQQGRVGFAACRTLTVS